MECFSVSQMRVVDNNLSIAEMLRELLDVKIRKSRREMLDTYRSREDTGPDNGVTMGSSSITGYSYRQ
jgi:hypothetical protein